MIIRRRTFLAGLLSSTAARSEIITPSPCSVANSITPCTGSGGGGPSPTVTSLTPNNGPGGTSVAIVGTNFTGATAVTFGSTAATSFTVNSATSITAVAPAGTGVVNVIVTVAGHSSAPGAGNQYTYPASPPTVTSLTPNGGPSGTSVAVAGTSFTGATAVAFGGTAATSFTFNSDISITAVAPAGSGTVNVTVTTPGGTSATGAGNQYTYSALPVVTSLMPNNGASGTSVAVAGTGFTAALSVAFGGTSATSFTETSDTSITAVAPAGSGTVNVTVTTPAGTSATGAGNQYTYPATGVTFDPANKNAGVTLSNGNLTAAAGSNWHAVKITNSHTTGKYYCEVHFDSGTYLVCGISNASFSMIDGNYNGIDANGTGVLSLDGTIHGGTSSNPCDACVVGGIFRIAVDVGASEMWVAINGGQWNGADNGNPSTGTGVISIPVTGALYLTITVYSAQATANFGATAYAYAAPAGFLNWDGTTPSAPAVTFDPANAGANLVLSNGNLTVTASTGVGLVRSTTSHSTGKFYVEFTDVSGSGNQEVHGIANASASLSTYGGGDTNSGGYRDFGMIFYNGGSILSMPGYSTGAVVQMAVDIGAGLTWWSLNGGQWNNSGTANPATGVGGLALAVTTPWFAMASFLGSGTVTANFGATAYAYTPPTGFGNW